MDFKSVTWSTKLRIAIFLVFISFPIIDTVFKLTGENENIENRILSRFPKISWENRERIKDQFESYFKDNFKPRGLLFKLYSRFKIEILQVSPSPNVVIGKRNWFFLGDGNPPFPFNAIKDYRGVITFNQKELTEIVTAVKKNKSYLDSLGINYYIAVAPNAQSIYPEYLPDYILKVQKESRVQVIQKALDPILGSAFINLIPFLLASKDSIKEPLYYRTNTHWNPLGAYFGYRFIINRLSQDFKGLSRSSLSSFNIKKGSAVYGDLTLMIGFEKQYQEPDILLVEKRPTPITIDSIVYQVPKDFYRKPLDYYIRHKSKNGLNLKILVFRDSFSSALQQFFPLNFQNSVFIWDMKLDRKIIEKEKPNIVIQIVVERAIYELRK